MIITILFINKCVYQIYYFVVSSECLGYLVRLEARRFVVVEYCCIFLKLSFVSPLGFGKLGRIFQQIIARSTDNKFPKVTVKLASKIHKNLFAMRHRTVHLEMVSYFSEWNKVNQHLGTVGVPHTTISSFFSSLDLVIHFK